MDNGFSRAELQRRCVRAGIDYPTIKAVFVTHMHPDHSKGVGTIARKDNLTVYASSVCHDHCLDCEYARLGIPESCQAFMSEDDVVRIGGFEVRCFFTSHDSAGSVGYQIGCEGVRLCIVTDTGVFDQRMVDYASESDVLFLESNYDVDMLRTGPYPPMLKRRIHGQRGHLSNDQAEEFLQRCGISRPGNADIQPDLCYNHAKSGPDKVYLVHLSDTNNSVSLLRSRFGWMGDRIVVCPKGGLAAGSIGG